MFTSFKELEAYVLVLASGSVRARARTSSGWWVHLGVKGGGIPLFPRPPTPRCRPPHRFQVNGNKVVKIMICDAHPA